MSTVEYRCCSRLQTETENFNSKCDVLDRCGVPLEYCSGTAGSDCAALSLPIGDSLAVKCISCAALTALSLRPGQTDLCCYSVPVCLEWSVGPIGTAIVPEWSWVRYCYNVQDSDLERALWTTMAWPGKVDTAIAHTKQVNRLHTQHNSCADQMRRLQHKRSKAFGTE